jgi:hypothetical protein
MKLTDPDAPTEWRIRACYSDAYASGEVKDCIQFPNPKVNRYSDCKGVVQASKDASDFTPFEFDSEST